MSHSLGQREGLSRASHGLIGITTKPEYLCRVIPTTDAGIVSCVDISQGMMFIRIIRGDAKFDMRFCSSIVSHEERRGPLPVMRLEKQIGIRRCTGYLHALVAKLI